MNLQDIKVFLRNIILITLPLGGVGGSLCSCSDFLQEEDKDKVIPRTIEQFEAMLHQEGFVSATWFYRSEFMTDDVAENTTVITTAKNQYKALYTWQNDVERTGEGDYSDENNVMWRNLYSDILVANYVLERAEDIIGIEATESRKSQLIGEAYFLRARAYLELVNIYAEPYDEATAAVMQGIPLREGTGITNNYARNTIARVYQQIEEDLAAAINAFDNSTETKSLWHPNKKAALLLLSRVYLYKGEWQNVINTTTTLMKLCPLGLYAINKNINDPVVRTANQEVFHTYGVIAGVLVDNASEGVLSEIPKIYRVEGSMSIPSYCVSDELLNLYCSDEKSEDMRMEMYFKGSAGKTLPAKWHPKFTTLGGYSYRLAEAYLNRAEAYAALGKTQEAVADMKELLSKRIDGDYLSMLPDASDQMAVRRFVLDQRRLELCFENHRWYDLRRTQKWYPKNISHVFSYATSTSGYVGTVNSTETYVLRPTSSNYTFELPISETIINTEISLYNKREDIKAE